MTQGQFNHISNFDLGCCWLLKVETYFFFIYLQTSSRVVCLPTSNRHLISLTLVSYKHYHQLGEIVLMKQYILSTKSERNV